MQRAAIAASHSERLSLDGSDSHVFTCGVELAVFCPAELREITAEYNAAIMGRYTGRVPRWCVVDGPLAAFLAQATGRSPSGN